MLSASGDTERGNETISIMTSIIKKILFVVTFFLLLLYLLMHILTTSGICDEEVIFRDKNYIFSKQSLCYGGASGGADVALVISYNGKVKEILKTYSNNGTICIMSKDNTVHIFTDAKKLYFIKENIYIGRKKIKIIKIPHKESKMKCTSIGSKQKGKKDLVAMIALDSP